MEVQITPQEEVSELIKSIPSLASLPPGELQAIMPHIRTIKVRPGKCITREGAQQSELLFVSSGTLKVSKSTGPKVRDRKEIILSLITAGEFFGEIALLTGSTRSADVTALTPATLLTIGREEFLQHIDRYPGLSKKIMCGMAARISSASQKITDLALYDVAYRLRKTLWNMGDVVAKEGKKISILNKQPTQKMIANMIGSSREVISRALKLLKKNGEIFSDGTLLCIKSFEG